MPRRLLDLQEAAQRQTRSRPRRRRGRRASRISALTRNASASTSEVDSIWPRIAGSASSLPSRSSRTAASEPTSAADQALEHERAADEPVRRADELHHLDLAASREDREADRVRDQQRRRDQEHDHRDQEDDLDHARDVEDAVGGLLAVLDLLDAGGRRVRGWPRSLRRPRRAPASTSTTAGSGFEGRFCGQLRALLLHPLERLAASRRT